MAGNDHYSCATPAASTASSTEPSQKTQPLNRLLQALCVFQHLSNPEVLKSVQLYSEDGSMSAIQQELTFSPNGYAQITEPIPSYFSKYSAIDSEDFFNTLKKINEIDLWTCIFEYHKHRVPASIPHLLSVSNNPLLQSLPCLAYDLMLVEKDIQIRACDLSQVVVPPPRLEVDRSHQDSLHFGGHLHSGNKQPSPQGRLLQSPTKWSLSAVSALTGHSEHTEEGSQREPMTSPDPGGHDGLSQQESEVDELGGHGHDIEMHPVETNLHEWGSDLELASPRIFHPCQRGSSWSTSTMSGVPFPGGLSGLSPTALSPTSSMVSNQKGAGLDPNCTSWNSSLFIANGDGYPLDPSSSFSNHSGLTPLKPINSEFPNSPVSPGSLLESSVSSILDHKHVRHLNPAGHLERLVDRCPSHCSDESVGTPLSALRIGQAETLNSRSVGLSLQPLGNSLGGDKERFMYRDLGLAGYSLEGATGCPAPRNFSGLQQEDFTGCARLSAGQAEDFGAGRLEVYHGGQVDNFAGCQSETFSGFQTEGIYAPRGDTFPSGHADIFWNENFLRDCRNEGLLLRETGRNEAAAYLHDGRGLCHEEPMLRDPSRNESPLLRDDGFALDCREVNYPGQASDMSYFMKDTSMGNISTKDMLQKVSGNAQGHSHQRGPSERMTEITLAELSHYFNMPITQASKELKVGLTVLKKRCREFGIPRWPHRKMKSLDSLIHNIQELAKGPEGQTSVPVQNAVRELECQKKRMEERPGIELAERTKRLRQACFKASYKKRRQAQIEGGSSSQSGNSRQSKSLSPCYDTVPSSSGARSGSVDQCISATMVS